MQNAADLGAFYRCEDCACMLHIISLSAQISQNVKYWYEICDVLVPITHALVPIFHSVKFAECEIFGSTWLYKMCQMVTTFFCVKFSAKLQETRIKTKPRCASLNLARTLYYLFLSVKS